MSLQHPGYEVGGTDIGHDQDPIKWPIFAPKNHFIILRAGDAISVPPKDYKYDEYLREITSRNIPMGTYFYLRANESPSQQAQEYLDIIKGNSYQLGAYMDLEVEDKVPVDKNAWSNHVGDFLRGVDKGLRIGSERLCGIYTRAQYWNQYINPSLIPNLIQRRKWIAWYPYVYTTRPKLPNGWPNADFWQCATTGQFPDATPGKGKEWGVYSYGLDLDVYLGTKAQFETTFRVKIPDILPPTPSQIPIGIQMNRIASIQNIPGDITIGKIILGSTRIGPSVKLPVFEQKYDNQQKLWYKIGGNDKYEMWIPASSGTPIYQ